MHALSGLLLVVALVAVLAVLGLGVLNMARGGPPIRSQRLMRARVLLQGFAILALLAFLVTRG